MIREKNYDVFSNPHVTEKATILGELNKYVFKVHTDANKAVIKESVENIFKVKVKSVNVINTKGKVKRFKGRLGKRAATRKAIVTLEAGQNLDLSAEV